MALACSGILISTVALAAVDDIDSLLHSAVAGSWRSDAHKARDQYRHPVETLEFFGLKPDMTVIELAPGGGWYTEILAPVLREHGQLIAAYGHGNTSSAYPDKFKADPAVYGSMKFIAFDPPKQVDLGTDNSADMVLATRVTHDWLNDDPKELAAVFQAIFKVLKPGGILGIEEHRSLPNQDAVKSSMTLHRIPEDYMISLGLDTGFVLAGISQINANPKDDHSLNVHMLPPDLLGDESQKAAKLAVGESDRMTVKFIKPLAH